MAQGDQNQSLGRLNPGLRQDHTDTMSDKIHAPIGASYRGEEGLEKSVRLLGLLIGEELWGAISERATVYTPTYERKSA
jgi:hypothetical protein